MPSRRRAAMTCAWPWHIMTAQNRNASFAISGTFFGVLVGWILGSQQARPHAGRAAPAAAAGAPAPPSHRRTASRRRRRSTQQRASTLEQQANAQPTNAAGPRRARQPLLRRRALRPAPIRGTRRRSSSTRRTSTSAPTSASATTTRTRPITRSRSSTLAGDRSEARQDAAQQGIVRAFGKQDLAGRRRSLAAGRRDRAGQRRGAARRSRRSTACKSAHPGGAGRHRRRRRPAQRRSLDVLIGWSSARRRVHRSSRSVAESRLAAVRAAPRRRAARRPRPPRRRRARRRRARARSAVRHLRRPERARDRGRLAATDAQYFCSDDVPRRLRRAHGRVAGSRSRDDVRRVSSAPTSSKSAAGCGRAGFVASNDGNISVRLDADRLLMTPKSVSKGFMTPDMMVVTDLDGTQDRRRAATPSSELLMHLEVYRQRPDVGAVVHAHPPLATGFAVAGIPLDRAVLAEVVTTLGSIPIAEYAHAVDARSCRRPSRKYIKAHDGLLLANHGALDARRATCSPRTTRWRRSSTSRRSASWRGMLGREHLLSREEVDAAAGAARARTASRRRRRSAPDPAAGGRRRLPGRRGARRRRASGSCRTRRRGRRAGAEP